MESSTTTPGGPGTDPLRKTETRTASRKRRSVDRHIVLSVDRNRKFRQVPHTEAAHNSDCCGAARAQDCTLRKWMALTAKSLLTVRHGPGALKSTKGADNEQRNGDCCRGAPEFRPFPERRRDIQKIATATPSVNLCDHGRSALPSRFGTGCRMGKAKWSRIQSPTFRCHRMSLSRT